MIAEKKTNRSSTSRQSSRRPSNAETTVNPKQNFVADFFKLCTYNGVFPLPEFRITVAAENLKITSENSGSDKVDQNQLQREGESNEFPRQKKKSAPVFGLIYDNKTRLESPKDLRCKGYELNVSTLNALKIFTTISTLKLQRCAINASGIVQISEILSEGSDCCIKDLNLDMNPNVEQNYHLLCAPGTSLIYLSLKFCEINDNGVANIASNLSHQFDDYQPHAPKLIVLNLANNRISETGGKFIGNMLRTNRSLQSLTLTGNRINDAGAECILANLTTFTLTHDEVVEKRRRKLKRLKLCREKIDDLCLEVLETEVEEKARGSTAAGSKKRRSSSRQVISNSNESSANRSTPIIFQSLKEKAEARAEAMIPEDSHPLSKDVIQINGTLTCPGNFKLQHLNLSFNKIGENTLQRIIDCVRKQKSILNNDVTKGLQYIDVKGNEFAIKSYDLAMQQLTKY